MATNLNYKVMEKELSPEQSLQLISRMISEVKSDYREKGFLYLLWGWLVLGAGLIHYVLLLTNLVQAKFAWFSWPLFMLTGGVITFIHKWKQGNSGKPASYVTRHMWSLYLAFVVTLIVSLVAAGNFEVSYPFIMLLYGMTSFAAGFGLKFKPLWIGGILSWLIGAIAFQLPFETQLLLLCLVVVISYLIPGYILKRGTNGV